MVNVHGIVDEGRHSSWGRLLEEFEIMHVTMRSTKVVDKVIK